MTVLRIVTNISAENPEAAVAFYRDLLGMEIVMDQGWIVTYSSNKTMTPQISIASEGGSGTPVPDVSIEVDNIDYIYAQAITAKFEILYELTQEPWGIRRFYVRDPLGRTVNILEHSK